MPGPDPWFIRPVPEHLGFDSRKDRLISGVAVQICPWAQEKLKGWIKFIRPFLMRAKLTQFL